MDIAPRCEFSLDYRIIFEAVPDPCLVLDRQFRMLAANKARLRMTKSEMADLVGRSIFDVFTDNPDDPDATGARNLRLSLERVVKTRVQDVMAIQRYDLARPPSEGGGFEKRYWSPINTPVLGPDGQVLYIVHRVQDVTDFVLSSSRGVFPPLAMNERRDRNLPDQAENYNRGQEIGEINLQLKQANRELEKKNDELLELTVRLEQEAAARIETQSALHRVNDQLQRSNKSLELFASIASHDLQEPLHTITSYSELLARRYPELLDEKGRQYIRFILDGTGHMHNMINDLLAYSRVSTRARPLIPIDLGEAMRQALNNLRQSMERSDATIQLVDLPQVEGDLLQLTQLFQNLLGNALKFARKDVPPVVRVTCDPDPQGWRIGVHDNGIGIEERFFDKIFEIFRRLHTRQEYEGTGIGLAICKGIVEHHGGRIWVESVLGQGATFYFTLRGADHEN